MKVRNGLPMKFLSVKLNIWSKICRSMLDKPEYLGKIMKNLLFLENYGILKESG